MAKHVPTNSAPKPIYVIYGPEQYLRDQARRRVLQMTIGSASDEMGQTQFEGDTALANVLDELNTLPLLASYRLVAVLDADDFISRYRESLERYCESPSTTASLLLICDQFDARTRLFKAVTAIGEGIKCEPLKGRSVVTWIVQQAQEACGKILDERSAWLLRNLVGDDLGRLDSELRKLATFVGDRPSIRAEDIHALVGLHREEKVFGIADAWVDRDSKTALTLWEQVWETDRSAVGRALAGLAWAVRGYTEAKSATMQGAPLSKFTSQFWRMKPDLFKMRMDRLRLADCEKMIAALHRADLDSKTGLSDTYHAIQKLIVEQCAGSIQHSGPGTHLVRRTTS